MNQRRQDQPRGGRKSATGARPSQQTGSRNGRGTPRADPRRRGQRSTQRFLLTCAAGFEHIVAKAASDDVRGLDVDEVDSGLVFVSVRSSANDQTAVRELPYLSGVHHIVVALKHAEGTPDAIVGQLARRLNQIHDLHLISTATSFRIRVIQVGQPVPISPDARNKLEASVRAWSDMGVKRDGAESEVWAYTRRADPRAWLLHRLDSPSKRSAARGSLKPDLAAALLRAEPISPGDVFLDGFAGSGSIAAARAHSPCSRIEICESDSDAVKRLRQRGNRGDFGRSFTIHHSDIRQLLARGLAPGSIDVAVLDPPWGEFDDSLDDVSLIDLYEGTCKMLSEALRVGGRAVFLVSQKARSLDTLDLGGLEIVSSHNALVNGKKARIVRMTRLGGPVREPA